MARGVRELFIAHPDQWSKAEPVLAAAKNSFLAFVEHVVMEQPAEVELTPDIDHLAVALEEFVIVDGDRDESRPRLNASPTIDTAVVCAALAASGLAPERLGRCGHVTVWELARAGTAELVTLANQTANRSGSLENVLPPEIQLLGERNSSQGTIRSQCGECGDSAHDLNSQLIRELLSRQSADGGWSPTWPREVSSCPATTAGVVECLCRGGIGDAREAIRRGVEYLRVIQRGDGSWESAIGVRLVHGTAMAVRALKTAGGSPSEPAVEMGINWLLVHQQPSGGWGEAPPAAGGDEMEMAPASATQTAWAISALVLADMAADQATLLGVQFLIETQEDEGAWRDGQFTLRDPAQRKWYRDDLRSAAESLAALSHWAVAISPELARSKPVALKLCVT
jgi:hypothetical protein